MLKIFVMPSYRFILFLFFISSFMACESSEEIEPAIIIAENIGLFASGEIREKDQVEFTPFLIDMKGDGNEFTQLIWYTSVALTEFGATSFISAFPSERDADTPRFGLQFWPPELSDQLWTAASLEDFFVPGSTFSFGRGVGKVDVFLQFPIGGPYDVEASRSSYLAAPQGSLTILSIEDYDYPTDPFSGDREYGKLVRCTFSGQLGRYDYEADMADGKNDFFETDEVVELENGEVLFYAKDWAK